MSKKTCITKDPLEAADFIKRGKIVVFPTETVYGIGASSLNQEACLEIYSIKNRPLDNPFIVHVYDLNSIKTYVHLDKKKEDFIQHFSPGPISYILPKKGEIFSTGLDTIGVRIPSHDLFRKMLELSGPISAPSANLSGKPSITRFGDAVEIFTGRVDCILEGDSSDLGIESTVVDLSSERPIILRQGAIPFQKLKEFDGDVLDYQFTEESGPKSPGRKYRHYSPNCKVAWYEEGIEIPDSLRFACIGSPLPGADFSIQIHSNRQYMHELYSFFIECDRRNLDLALCIRPFPDCDAPALMNRIEKAISGM